MLIFHKHWAQGKYICLCICYNYIHYLCFYLSLHIYRLCRLVFIFFYLYVFLNEDGFVFVLHLFYYLTFLFFFPAFTLGSLALLPPFLRATKRVTKFSSHFYSFRIKMKWNPKSVMTFVSLTIEAKLFNNMQHVQNFFLSYGTPTLSPPPSPPLSSTTPEK